jgi:hypothetical protein
MKWLEAYWRNLAPVDGFLPLFIGFQPSFWWCRIYHPRWWPQIGARERRLNSGFAWRNGNDGAR